MVSRGWVFVALQFSCIAWLLFSGPLFARDLVWFFLEVVGIVLGVWAVWIMRKSKLSVLPELRNGAQLIATGPYRWVRHPMYTALLITCGALLLDHFTITRLVAFALLIVTLVVKLKYEEGLLERQFGEAYRVYRKNRKRLIPFIF